MESMAEGSERLLRVVRGLIDDMLQVGDPEQQSADWQRAWQDLNRELERDSDWDATDDAETVPPLHLEIPTELHDDYRNLDVPLTATMVELHSAYRSALRKYHPDRFDTDPHKFAIATEVAMRLNQSWLRIRAFHSGQARRTMAGR